MSQFAETRYRRADVARPAGCMTRRRFFEHSLAWGLGSAALSSSLSGCGFACQSPIDWAPTLLAPVFYGYQEFSAPSDAPADLRVYYPSLDGNPHDAAMLTCSGFYPFVLFVHGQCEEERPEHYLSWASLPLTLARSGFVVAVFDMGWNTGDLPWTSNPDQYTRALDVIDWMHTTWTGREWLSDVTTLGLVGHSYGALIAGRLATDIDNSAYVSIGGGWADWYTENIQPVPIEVLAVPSLFMFGTNDARATLPPPNWTLVPGPTHRVYFHNKGHWDHLDASATACGSPSGDCNLVEGLTADLAAIFLSKYMRVAGIPDSLEPPPFALSPDQTFYAGAHLTNFDRFASDQDCANLVTIEWSTSVDGSVDLPWP